MRNIGRQLIEIALRHGGQGGLPDRRIRRSRKSGLRGAGGQAECGESNQAMGQHRQSNRLGR
jgi:hypothetical protein